MTAIRLEKNANTPSISFDPSSGVMEIKGRSNPEDPLAFYRPLNEWIESYIASPAEETTVHIHLEYFNTSSSKCLLDVLKKFGKLHKEGKLLAIHWWYESYDEDMKETGIDYQDVLGLSFILRETN